MLLKEEKMKML